MSPNPDATTNPGPADESPPPPKPPQRVAPISVPPEDVALPKPDEQQPAQIRDAFRECTFALPREIAWLREALSLQRQIVAASTGSRWRNHRYAATLLFWSRIYNAGIELLTATTWANYAVCPPLVRASLEWLAAEQAVVGDEIRDYEEWLAAAFEPEREYTATDIGMGQYLAGQQIAMAPGLEPIYRAAAELARPHFGASAMLVAPESNRQRIAVHWGDRAFHLGWAQMLLGWQIVIHERQVRFAVGRELFAVGEAERERYRRLSRQAETLLGERDRCRIEWITQQGRPRLLIHNFRRQPGGAPRRLLL